MSGKFEKKKAAQKAKHSQKRSARGCLIALLVVLFLLLGLVCLAMLVEDEEETVPTETTTVSTSASVSTPQADAKLDTAEEVSFDLGNGLTVTDLGAYTGIYMEDGSDEVVSGVMMIIVTNSGENTLQYAKITLSGEGEDAVFTLSTLQPGASVVVLEADRRSFTNGETFTAAVAENLVFFQEPLSAREDLFEIQTLDGGFNITNISGRDITGKIVIYYKYSSGSLYYGGITYRGSIEGGMAAGEIKQVMSQHFSASGTSVLYITVSEE